MHKFWEYNGTQKFQDALKEEKVCQLHRKNNYLVSKKILQLLLTTLKVLKDQAIQGLKSFGENFNTKQLSGGKQVMVTNTNYSRFL